MTSVTLAAPLSRGPQDEIADAGAAGRAAAGFVRSRLAIGLLGVLAVAPYLALRPGVGPADALLAFGLAAPLGAATVASRAGRLDVAYAVAAAGHGALVCFVLLAAGTLGWPALLFLAAVPLEARSAGAARMAALVSAAFAPLMLVPGEGGHASTEGASLAACFLIAGLLIEPALRRFAPGPGRDLPADAAAAEAPVLATFCDLVTWHDGVGDVIRVAGAADRISGRPASALLGNGLFGQIHIPDRPAYLKALSDAANGSLPVTVELRLLVADAEAGGHGTRLAWTEMRAHAIGGGAGRTVPVIRDASASRRHAEELEAARCEAERASDMKGRFLATVSHELRTPLNAIIGFSELLAADHPYAMSDERRKEYAAIIRDSGHHLLAVVNTLLDISKIESGNFAVTPEPFGMGDLAQGCCDLMQLKADQAGVTLVRRIAADLPDLTGDRRACRQILINLLSNAVKFTPAGGRISVEVSREGERLRLSIADEGIGIREADLPRLGDPFFQAGDLHRRPHEGTGLGLSVVRGLVGLHRGAMTIESGPGLGTTVTVCLPLEARPAPESAKPVAVRTAARRPAPLFERMSA